MMSLLKFGLVAKRKVTSRTAVSISGDMEDNNLSGHNVINGSVCTVFECLL